MFRIGVAVWLIGLMNYFMLAYWTFGQHHEHEPVSWQFMVSTGSAIFVPMLVGGFLVGRSSR